jgi:signal transduction histidine kinase
VDVRVSAWNGTVELEVRDDGTGFDLAQYRPGHFGLESMRSRAAEIEAELTIASRPGTGTVVRVEVPAGGEDGPDAPGG